MLGAAGSRAHATVELAQAATCLEGSLGVIGFYGIVPSVVPTAVGKQKRVRNVNFMTGGVVNENSPEDEMGLSSGQKPGLSCHWVLVWLGRSSVTGNLCPVGDGGLGTGLGSTVCV